MDITDKSTRVTRELADKHLQSIVSLRACWKDSKGGRQPITTFCTGSIIYSSENFALVLSCSHNFRAFHTCYYPAYDSPETLRNNIFLLVDFCDGYSSAGSVYGVDWDRDLSLTVVTFSEKKSYRAVKFLDDENPSIYERGTPVYSMYCFPTNQQDDEQLFGTTSHGNICGLPITGKDLDPVFKLDLEMFEFSMPGSSGCSGAPIFSEDLQVMGIWISAVGDLKFGLKISSIRECFQRYYHVEATNMDRIVSILSSAVSRFVNIEFSTGDTAIMM